jgi:hypothetical protein
MTEAEKPTSGDLKVFRLIETTTTAKYEIMVTRQFLSLTTSPSRFSSSGRSLI